MSLDYASMTLSLDQAALEALAADSKLKAVKIQSKIPLGEKLVFDLEIENPDGLFFVNGVIAHNCKEALIGREYTEFNALESTGYVKIEIEGEIREYPAKTSVKFYDPEVGHIVYGPIQVPIAYGYPIAQDSLSKLRSGVLGRLSAD